ncbi:MAG: exopolysaccharide Pel transporter PelG [Gammaproteobacteria bacterium]|nr:exopolysaccharide Pel transporter PelG [Gammaproteobacteria bacterium]MCW5584205.1 exopolysaccharide Pel transporter PelG [Gammaproteobacteria bacterium]
MAGIGFELRKLLAKGRYVDLFQAYGYAGIVGAGPWIISILGILFLGILLQLDKRVQLPVAQFQVSVTYLISSSLIFSSFAQHSFTRYVADTLFSKHMFKVIPNLNGLLLIITFLAGAFAYFITATFFPVQDLAYRFLMMGCFVILCDIWVLTNLLAGLKDYKVVLYAFVIGYSLIVCVGLTMKQFGVDGYLLGFMFGHAIIFLVLASAIYHAYPSTHLIDFEFLKPAKRYYSLMLTSLFFNLAIWADKYLFWFNPLTSESLIGPLRSSPLYDIPIFLAYLAILPGMAVFLLRLETDFSEYYIRFNESIREGGSLEQIQVARDQMISYAKYCIIEIIKVQAIVVACVFLVGDKLLNLLNISLIYRPTLNIDVIGSSLQVVFLGILNITFYLDKRMEALQLSLIAVILNVIFTMISIHLGPNYYGFGFTFAFFLTCTFGYYWLSDMMEDLEYKMIMLR